MDLRYIVVVCVIIIILLIFKIATKKCDATEAKGSYWIYENGEEMMTYVSPNFVKDVDYIPIAKFTTWLNKPAENAVEINLRIQNNRNAIGTSGAPGMNLFGKSEGSPENKLCIIKSTSGKVLHQRIGKCNTPDFKNIPPWQIDRFFYVEDLKTWYFPKYRFSINIKAKKYWIAECGRNEYERRSEGWSQGFICCGLPDGARDFSGNKLALAKLNIWEADGNRWLLPAEEPVPAGAIKYGDLNFLVSDSSEIATRTMNLYAGTSITKILSDGIKSSLRFVKQYFVPYRSNVDTQYFS